MPALGESGESALRLSAALADRYEVVREHRRGGMALVYLAVDRKHDRQVALKVLDADLAAGIGAERFLREIEIAAHLTHPHILPLLDSGLVDGLPYYVMPFVEEESLRERLARGGPLPVDEALRIAHDVAEALAYAHGNDVVHRDIKPGNVMLAGESAVVTDFGIAVAMDEATEHLTRTGHSVGTAGYMSPEQASGDHDVDGRSDQYSLACVLFEMLTGDPPFTGRNARAILGRQLSQPVPDVSDLRDSVPEGLDDVLRRALGRVPADRYPTMRDFADALEDSAHRAAIGVTSPGLRSQPGFWAGLVTLGALAIATPWLLPALTRGDAEASAEALVDTARYAIFPFRYSSSAQAALNETQRLRDALTRWTGISVVLQNQLEEAVLQTGQGQLSPEDAARIAVKHGAGRSIVGEISMADDAYRIHAALYGGEGNRLEDMHVRVPASVTNVDSVFAELVDGLLFPNASPGQVPSSMGTTSVAGRRAFDAGLAALRWWNLSVADSAFQLAVEHDAAFGRAHLWLALTRAWSDQDPSRWTIPAEQATLHQTGLTERDVGMAEALQAQASGDFGRACSRWRSLTRSEPRDFAGWYGLAMCLANDHAVVPDQNSPSKWRFRASRQEALNAYQTAFGYLPSILESFHSNAYESLRGLFYLAGSTVRTGSALPPDTMTFRAVPTWRGDTLAFVPVSLEQYIAGEGTIQPEPDEIQAAVRNLRRLFVDVARAWVANAPGNGRARHALAIGLGMTGDPSALDTLAQARRMTVAPIDSLTMASTEIWLRIGLGFPDDTASLRRAKSLADSLLKSKEQPLSDARLGAALAALTGDAQLAAAYARRWPPAPTSRLPPSSQADARALGMFAAIGGPPDSLVRLERTIAAAIARLPEERRRRERGMWLVLPASLSFPVQKFETMGELAFDWVIEAQLALADGDTSAVRAALRSEAERRLGIAAYDVTLDALYPEAHLLQSLGDAEAAVQWLDPTLQTLPQMDLTILSEPARIAALIRGAALRATLAETRGEPEEARQWASSVLLFWSEASAAERTVDRMRRIAERHDRNSTVKTSKREVP